MTWQTFSFQVDVNAALEPVLHLWAVCALSREAETARPLCILHAAHTECGLCYKVGCRRRTDKEEPAAALRNVYLVSLLLPQAPVTPPHTQNAAEKTTTKPALPIDVDNMER